jgi:ABC-type lipoprotein export system ATPase subunit
MAEALKLVAEESAPSTLTAEAAVVAENVKKHFSQGGHVVKAVDGVSMVIPAGQLTAITGPSGSGKTTLLYLIGSLEKPSEGALWVAGTDVGRLSNSSATSFRRHKVGFIFQSFNLIPNLSAIENVMVPMELDGKPKSVRQTRARDLLDTVGIRGRLHDHWPGKLSGGEQQRVAIARALANEPKLILADEPTGNLDSETGELVIDVLKDLASSGTAIVLVTHDNDMAKLADERFRMRDGRLAS